MNWIVIGFGGVGAFVAAAAIVAWLRLLKGNGGIKQSDAAWLQEFTSDRYRVVNRLLAQEDVQYLKSLGVNSAFVAEFRRSRRRLLKLYLSELCADFATLVRLAKFAMVQSSVDQTNLACDLTRQRLQFQICLIRVRACLLLGNLGFRRWHLKSVERILRLTRMQLELTCAALQDRVPVTEVA